jgi:cytoskeletal protein CcmA (bactofilin family)
MVVHLIDSCQISGPHWRTINRHSLGATTRGRFEAKGLVMADERRKAAWIGGSILVKGDVVSTEDLMIDGQVQGTIELGDHSLTIGPGASVVADLVAKNVTISGELKGNVIVGGKMELKSTAKVEGDISAPHFVMEEGATLSGKVDTGKKGSKAP